MCLWNMDDPEASKVKNNYFQQIGPFVNLTFNLLIQLYQIHSMVGH